MPASDDTDTSIDVRPYGGTAGQRDAEPITTPRRGAPTAAESDPATSLVRRDSFRELLPGSVVDDIYEIDARLGAGAMGEVYAARHLRLGKRVAIKVIGPRLSEDEAAIERFALEAQTLAQIQHPAIVAVEHVGELADGRAYFVMEYLRGGTLFEHLSRGRVPLTEALRVLDQMARGLDAAHAQGVIHRDLKPENTFLVHLPGEQPIVKLVDFGLAKLAETGRDHRAERTQSGVAIGTPMYMSPEQARGPDVDHRTDIYALGCVAYELILGVPPFPHARTVPELYAAHLHEAPPLPRSIWPEIPPQLDLVLFAMLAKDAAHRPTLAQLRAVIAGVRPVAPSQRAATAYVGPRAIKHRRTLATTAIVVLVTLIAGIVIGAALTTATPSAPVTPQIVTPAPAPAPTIAPPTTPTPAAPIQTPIIEQPTGSASRPPLVRPLPKAIPTKIVTPHVPAVPVDAAIDDVPVVQTSKPDRNQTVNPFKHKATP